jgi:hypothetical protein
VSWTVCFPSPTDLIKPANQLARSCEDHVSELGNAAEEPPLAYLQHVG